MLETNKRILENTYLYLANRSYGKTQKRIHERVICQKCGRADKTLLKMANGYVCKDCLKELHEQDNER